MNKEQSWLLKEKYRGVESPAFYADCERLAVGMPLAYLIGFVPFLDCTINLDSYPLIPRPETEYWTEQAITAIKTLRRRQDLLLVNVLDLCAGSGAIGVAVAKAIPDSVVTFAELDPKHLPTIEKNITLNLTQPDSNHTINRMIRLGGQTILSGDLFENISPTTQFDFILTNPPYIDAKANTVELNVTEHEPHLALFGGAKGMEIIARIIAESPQFLTSGGQLWIEHEPFQSAVILEQALSTGYSTVITHPDQYGVPRFSILSMAQ